MNYKITDLFTAIHNYMGGGKNVSREDEEDEDEFFDEDEENEDEDEEDDYTAEQEILDDEDRHNLMDATRSFNEIEDEYYNELKSSGILTSDSAQRIHDEMQSEIDADINGSFTENVITNTIQKIKDEYDIN